nr:hypothetical protein [Bacillaceae bacterium]
MEKMQLDLPKTFFFFLTVHWKMKCNKKYVKAIDKRSSPPICVKSRAQSREHRLPEMERLCARFFLREFLDFIQINRVMIRGGDTTIKRRGYPWLLQI